MRGLERPGVFGFWDAPATDGMEAIPVPLNRKCMHCREHFQPDDNGAIMETGYSCHRECALRSVMGGIGHIVNHARYCTEEGDPDAGFSYRASAIMVWNDFQGVKTTEAMLDMLRGET
jgi:hypothetical protein